MITLKDCISLSELTEEEVAAIAEYKHLPEIIAAEYAHELLTGPAGPDFICAIIKADIAKAQARGITSIPRA